jgi:hypothetical protein
MIIQWGSCGETDCTAAWKKVSAINFWHRSFTFNSNKSQFWCNNFSVYYPDICLQLNKFRAFPRPSSGTQWLQWQPLVLPSYRGDSRAVFVVGPAYRVCMGDMMERDHIEDIGIDVIIICSFYSLWSIGHSFQALLSPAVSLNSFHDLPKFLISSSIVLRHVLFELPLLLYPWGFQSNAVHIWDDNINMDFYFIQKPTHALLLNTSHPHFKH